jgi:hypothetical protein
MRFYQNTTMRFGCTLERIGTHYVSDLGAVSIHLRLSQIPSFKTPKYDPAGLRTGIDLYLPKKEITFNIARYVGNNLNLSLKRISKKEAVLGSVANPAVVKELRKVSVPAFKEKNDSKFRTKIISKCRINVVQAILGAQKDADYSSDAGGVPYIPARYAEMFLLFSTEQAARLDRRGIYDYSLERPW